MPVATVVISTKNRCDELVETVRSALNQSVPVEVLVVDDGSTDGTSEIIRTQFPTVRLEQSPKSMGYIVQRNRAARLASSSIIFSLDDDACFASSDTVAQTLRQFDHPRIGAVAIPYIEPRKSNIVLQRAPDPGVIFITDTFVGTAYALRRDVFLDLSGYRERLFHQGEESDYCIRMLDAGYLVRLGTADPIHHMESPKRDKSRMDYYGRRNDILFAWHNVPLPYAPVHLLGTTANGLMTAIRQRRFKHMVRGLGNGYVDAVRLWNDRRPVSTSTYRLFRRIKKSGPVRLADIEAALPPFLEKPHQWELTKGVSS